MLRRQPLCYVLLLVGMLIFAGHVCELSASEHFVFIHAATDPAAPHEHGEDQHPESCDATRAGSALDAVMVVSHALDISQALLLLSPSILPEGNQVATDHPPLFLLHASFLN